MGHSEQKRHSHALHQSLVPLICKPFLLRHGAMPAALNDVCRPRYPIPVLHKHSTDLMPLMPYDAAYGAILHAILLTFRQGAYMAEGP